VIVPVDGIIVDYLSSMIRNIYIAIFAMTEVFGKCAWPNMEGGLTYLVSPSLGI
jgi:hypothetical protein